MQNRFLIRVIGLTLLLFNWVVPNILGSTNQVVTEQSSAHQLIFAFSLVGCGICWFCWGQFYKLNQDKNQLLATLEDKEQFFVLQKSDIERMQAELQEQKNKFEEATREIEEKNRALSQTNEELIRAGGEMRQTVESLRTVQSTVLSQNLALEAANKEISLKNLQLEEANRENLLKNKQLEDANTENTRKNEQLEAANSEIRAKNEQLQAANREIISKNEQLESAYRAISSQKEELERAYTEISEQKARLEKANQEISEQNKILAEKNNEVLHRTKELEDANALVATKNQQLQAKNEELIIRGIEIRTALEELKATQDSLIVAEKTGALVQVIANIAHEINNPIGAISAAAMQLQRALPEILDQLPQVYQTLPIEQQIAFNTLVKRMLEVPEPQSVAEERARRKIVEDWLKNKSVPQYETIAKRLVKFGIIDNLDNLMPLFQSESPLKIIETASALGGLQTNIHNVNGAVQRTQKTILTLKSYTDDPTLFKGGNADINQMLEEVLGFYRSPLKHRIEFATFYDTNLPTINCFPDQLSQVWVSLINNAIQAMEGKGTLTVTTGNEDNKLLVVQIQDTGPGIPPKILHRIFEPFFTTKSEGEATGLGLHLASKIVQKHKGSINVDSEPGNTVFTVKIPLLK